MDDGRGRSQGKPAVAFLWTECRTTGIPVPILGTPASKSPQEDLCKMFHVEHSAASGLVAIS